MRFATAWTRRAALVVIPLVLAAAVACGGDDDKATTSGGGASGAAANATGGTATVNMLDNKFDPPNVTMKANQETTITVDNKGKELHNWKVQNVKSKDGRDIKSELLAGGKQEAVKFTIEKTGTYDIVCEVHPVEMTGKLTVQ